MADIEPVNPPEPTPVPDDPSEPSLAEHEAQFTNRSSAPADDGEGDGEPEAPKPAATRGADGKFVKAEKHRAAKAVAGAEDVPRIAELTRKLREAERERDEWKARGAQTTTTPPQVQQPATPITAQAERDWNREVERYKNLPGFPKIDNFQDYGDAMLAQKLFIDEIHKREDREERQREAETAALTRSWTERVNDARTRYSDFDAVALHVGRFDDQGKQVQSPIPKGSLVDAWVLEDENGGDVLYELHRDYDAGGHLLRDILSAPSAIKQAKMLSQLALRLTPSTRTQAATTGAAVPTPRQAAPRPPTPVRTSAMQREDEPPDDESSSLADHEKFYGRKARRY